MIETKSFISHDDFVIIDDIEYNAQLCADRLDKTVKSQILSTTPFSFGDPKVRKSTKSNQKITCEILL